MCLPLTASITFNSDRQEAEAKGTLYLIGFHSAFLINKRRPSHRKILPLMALQGSRFGLGTKDFRHGDLQANKVGGLKEGFVKDSH